MKQRGGKKKKNVGQKHSDYHHKGGYVCIACESMGGGATRGDRE